MMLFESQKEEKNQFLMERKRKNNEKVFKKKTHKNAKTILVVAGKLKRKLKRYKENRFKIDDEKIW